MASVEIRRRRDSDVPALIEVLEDVYSTDGYPVEGTSTAAAFLSPQGIVQSWVAIQAGIVVGHIAIITGAQGCRPAVRAWVDLPDSKGDIEHTVVVARFFIRKHARNQGLGRKLVEHTCEWAQTNNMKIVMNVIDKDVGAMRLYEKLGFRRIGEGVYETHQKRLWTQYFYVYD